MAELHANEMHSRIVPKTGKCMVIGKETVKLLSKTLRTSQTGKFPIHKEKFNKMQKFIKTLLFHIHLKLNMFRATHRPSSEV
jgi:hypothetical protein